MMPNQQPYEIEDITTRKLLRKRLQALKYNLKFKNRKYIEKLIDKIIKEFCERDNHEAKQ